MLKYTQWRNRISISKFTQTSQNISVFKHNIPKKFFPRVTKSTIQPNAGVGSIINKLNPELNPNIDPKNREANMKLRQELQDEMDKPMSEDEESEEDIDEKFNQAWGKKEEIDYDPNFENYLDIAKCNDKVMEIPENLQMAAQKVFSKHVISDIRHWTSKFLLNYSQNHACEPPIDLTNLPEDRPLFANSEELNIKVKLFGAVNEKEEKGGNKKDKKDENVIDVEEEKKLNKQKENINPIKVEYKPAQCVAYLHSRMPYTYQVSKRICLELVNRLPDFKPDSILDYGAGLGSSIWAAHDVYPETEKFAAVEPNRDMRKLGKFLTTNGKLKHEILWVESLTMIPGTGSERGKFDLIFLSHVLQEVPTAKIRLMLLDTLFNRLKDNGVLVIVEPGSPKGYRFIHDLRHWVINKPRDDASIIAPCPHHLQCPLAGKRNDWCHFSQLSYKWHKTIFPRPSQEKQLYNEKFCYLTIRKGKTPNAVYQSEEEAKTDQEKSFFWERIIRPVIKKHRHSIIDMCTTAGKFERRITSKSHGTLGGHKTSKRLNWGDLWYVPYWIPNKFRKDKLKGKRLW